MESLVEKLVSGNAFTMRPRATLPPRTNADYILKEGLSREWCNRRRLQEHRLALACHDSPKKFFGYVNKHRPRAPLGPVFSFDGHLVTDDEKMAREFNNYFSNVFAVEDVDNIPDPVIDHGDENTLTDIDCTEPEDEAKQKGLKPDKAADSDGFLPKVLKAVADGVVSHLCQIFNRSLPTVEVPSDFRSAYVWPIPKKGLLMNTGNYRPISLTSVPGKVLESIIKDRAVNFLETYNIINTVFVRVDLVLQKSLTFTNTCSVSVTIWGPWI